MRIRGIDPRAVLLGVLLTFAIDLLGGMGLMMWLAPPELTGGQLGDADFERVLNDTLQSSAFLGTSLLLGIASHVLAAFVTARLARQAPYTNAMMIAFVGFVLGVVLYDPDTPFWYSLIGFACLVPASWLGAVLAERRATSGGH